MNASIDEVMRLLNGALCARTVYWADHPSALKPVEAAARLLAELHELQLSIPVVALTDRVVSAGAELPCGPDLLSGIFGKLRERHVDSLTFVRGVTDQELSGLLDQLSSKETATPPSSSPHLRVGHVAEHATGPQALSRGAGGGTVKTVWAGLIQRGVLDLQALDTAVADVMNNGSEAAGSRLSLTSLRLHDEYTFVHTTNVAVLAAAFGREIGLDDAHVHELTVAALLHDIGKRRVPREVLNKASSLTQHEFEIVSRHPSDGASMLFGLPDIPPLAAIVAYEHHMHPDGSGYPRIKIGRQMQIASQLVQIADVFDALRTHRPYRRGLTNEQARAVMYKDVRRFYDADLLDTFFSRVAHREDRNDSIESIPDAA